MQPPTRKAALAAYAKACATHQRKDWRMACHLLAAVVEPGPEPTSAPLRRVEPKIPTLCEFLSARGIRDDGGELTARDVEQWHRLRPFRRRLIREDGISLEHAADLAWEHGYFPHVAAPTMSGSENMHPVTGNMLIIAIGRELGGLQREPEEDPAYWEALEREAA